MGKSTPIVNIKKMMNIDEIKTDLDGISDLFKKHLDPISTAIEKCTESEVRKILINYFLIHFVSIIENFCKNKVISLIDDNDLDINSLFSRNEMVINIETINEIKKKGFTKGRLTAINFNFQNPDDINYVFSRLFSINLFETIFGYVEIKNNKKDDEITLMLKDLIKKWDEFLKLFDIRNQIVHSLKSIDYEKFNNDKLDKIFFQGYQFLIQIDLITAWMIFIKKGNKPQKRHLHLFNYYKNQIKK